MRNYSGNELWKSLGKASPRKNAEEAGRLGSLRRRLGCDWGGHSEVVPGEGLPLPFSHTHVHTNMPRYLWHTRDTWGYLSTISNQSQETPITVITLWKTWQKTLDWCILLGDSPASWPKMCTMGSFPSEETSVLSQIYFSFTYLFTSFSPFLPLLLPSLSFSFSLFTSHISLNKFFLKQTT